MEAHRAEVRLSPGRDRRARARLSEQPAAYRPQERQDSSDDEEAAETEQDTEHEGDGCSDSSDIDETAEAEPGRVGRPNHGGAAVQAGAWMRDDNYAVDERSKSGFAAQPAPQIAIVV